jgi:hypothetical protein
MEWGWLNTTFDGDPRQIVALHLTGIFGEVFFWSSNPAIVGYNLVGIIAKLFKSDEVSMIRKKRKTW